MAAALTRFVIALVCIGCCTAHAAAQDLERARALADLAQQIRSDDPGKAIASATEALAILQQRPEPRTQVRALNAMSWALMQRGQFADATARASEARTVAEQAGDRAGLGRAINNLGVIAQRSGDAVDAIEHFEASLAIYRELGAQVDIANALNNLGFVHGTDLADYEKSLEYHVEALRVRESLSDANAVALSLNNIGIVYARLREHERALQYFGRSLELRRASGGVNRSAGTLSNIGDVYLELGELDKALSHHQQSLEIRRRIAEKPGVANSLKNLGLVQTAMKRPAEARRHFNDALAVSREIRDRTNETQSLLGLAELERQLGRGAEAAKLARQALEIARAAGSRELQRRAWGQIAGAEELAGQPAAALAAFKQLKTLEDQIFAADKALRIDMLERRYQAERHQAENERLRTQQALSDLQASRSRLQRNAVAAAGVLMLTIGIILYRRRVDAARIASELSVTDALTGLRNRRFVQQTVDADVATALRRSRTDPDGGLVFMLLDIDHFKAVNDAHGHKAGDAILTGFAGILRATCRASDTIARWGGEEFLIVCRATAPLDAAVLAERLRGAVERHHFGLSPITCSIGLAPLPFDGRDLTWEQAVALADRALYEAKRQGRNRWIDARALHADALHDATLVAPATVEAGRA
ncbi:MAG: tetratricopeptide repeat-containing diguanylate cyclase [Vicinamibacterales bacterium]